ncbi:MAG: peptide chain release factor N(5)-glutamine methyltransferase, partial [Niameybacter sp.]
ILLSYNKLDAAIDARLLALHVLQCNTAELIMHGNEKIAEHLKESYMYMIARRAQGTPLQYITNSQEFMGLEFYVDERVLIPRQDTETLVETIIEYSKKHVLQQAVEIGTGSGCISVALAHYIKNLHITSMDICENALDVARKNVQAHQLEDYITLANSDVFKAYDGEEESLDMIVSNPPYITFEECKGLMQEVKEYEPRKALTDGGDGLKFYREITREGKKYLKQNGLLAYEIGYLQGKDVCAILEQEGFTQIKLIQDLAQRDRVVIGTKI